MYKEMFNYQKLDLQILKLKKENKETPYTKVMADAISAVKVLQEKTEKLGQDAEKQIENFNKLTASLESIEKEIEKLEQELDMPSEEIEKKVKDYSNQLNRIQSNISILKANIDKINKMFEDAKHKVFEAKNKHKQAKAKQDEIMGVSETKINALKLEMEAMEKNLDKALLKKYKDCKADNILPVYVMLTQNNACGGCMQELATNELNKLKQDKTLVCEHCRRIIIDRE